SDKSIALMSAGGVSVVRSNAIVPESFSPGARRRTRSVWSRPSVTARSVMDQSTGPGGGGAPRELDPDRATIVYSPGATPGIENPLGVTVARGSVNTPDDTSVSAGDCSSRRRGYKTTEALVIGCPAGSRSVPAIRAVCTTCKVKLTPDRSSPTTTV